MQKIHAGRPFAPKTRKDRVVSFRIREQDYRATAKKSGALPVAELARRLLLDWIAVAAK